MRSKTLSHLPGRCQRCWLREAFCICAEVRKVSLPWELWVVRHAREAYKSTTTSRPLALAVASTKVVDFDDDASLCNRTLEALGDEAWLLFPDSDPKAPRAEPMASRPWPAQLVVVDGTWRQTRRMVKKLPALDRVPRFSLPPKYLAPLRLRDSTEPSQRSTLEAVADVALLWGCSEASQELNRLHRLFVERTFRARGNWNQKAPEDGQDL